MSQGDKTTGSYARSAERRKQDKLRRSVMSPPPRGYEKVLARTSTVLRDITSRCNNNNSTPPVRPRVFVTPAAPQKRSNKATENSSRANGRSDMLMSDESLTDDDMKDFGSCSTTEEYMDETSSDSQMDFIGVKDSPPMGRWEYSQLQESIRAMNRSSETKKA